MVTQTEINQARALLEFEQREGRLVFPDSFVLGSLCDMMESTIQPFIPRKVNSHEYSNEAGSGPGQADPTGTASPTRSRHARAARRFGRQGS